jgi:spermidine/putrescine transport system substrate-binding protein
MKWNTLGLLGLGVAFSLFITPKSLLANANGPITLKVYNWGGYIYEKDAEIPGDQDLIDQFEAWYLEETGVQVNVEYTMYGTNEEMYNNVVQLEKYYDMFAPSDYMVQRLMSENYLTPLDYTKLPNYSANVSPYLKEVYDSLLVGSESVSDYAMGYMWGTVGLVYDPEQVDAELAQSWQVLYNTDYQARATIKDSVREVYMVGLMDVYQDTFLEWYEQYQDGELTSEQYNNLITEKINTVDATVLAEVEESLVELVNNAYGLETDSAKNDIVSQKISMFLAWSGDAAYAMDLSDEDDVALEYVIPQEGSNIWFDGFVLHKDITPERSVVAHAFMDYLSNVDLGIPQLNMNYIGYTSFMAGEGMLDNVLDLVESYNDGLDFEETASTEINLSYFFKGTIDPSRENELLIEVPSYRQVMTQYPPEDVIVRTAAFNDFGDFNDDIANMWSRVKSAGANPLLLPLLGGAILVIGVGVAVVSIQNKKSKRSQRNATKTK